MTVVDHPPVAVRTGYQLMQLGGVTTRAESVDPKKKFVDAFTYIDLSSVDQAQKKFSDTKNLKPSEAPSRARQVVQTSDVLISTVRPNLNGVAVVPQVLDGSIASTGFTVLRPDASKIIPSYLFQWVKSPQFIDDMISKATGASYPAISDKIVRESTIPLPPLPEQRRIAAVLDKADHLRTQRREAIAHLDALTQSMFVSMFGTPVAGQTLHPIVQIGDVLNSATYGTSEKASLEGDTPVLRMNNITYSGELDLTNLKYMPASQPEKHLVRDGDLLFNRTNSKELVGKTCVYRGSEDMAYAGYLVRLRLSDQMTPEYLNTFMNLGQTKQLLRNMCKSIVGMANINAKEVQKIRVPLPPLELQQTFARRVAGVERLKAQHRTQLAELDTLFASLQHRAFRGEL